MDNAFGNKMKFKTDSITTSEPKLKLQSPTIERPDPSGFITNDELTKLVIVLIIIVCLALLIFLFYIFYKICYKRIKLWASRSNLGRWTDGEVIHWANDTEQATRPYVIDGDFINSQTDVQLRHHDVESRVCRSSNTESRLSRISLGTRYSERLANRTCYAPCCYPGHGRDSMRNNCIPLTSRLDTSGPARLSRPAHCIQRLSDNMRPESSLIDELSVVNTNMFEEYIDTPRILLKPIERSKTIEVEGKLIVYITREVDSKGAILNLDNMGISLAVPAGAIDEKQLIILALNWDLSDNPFMDDLQALVSPVVYCGPHGVQLKVPALLRYKHCAFDPRGIQILESGTELTETKDWSLYCDGAEEDGKCKVTQDECQVLINHFTLFTSIQSPFNGDSNKWLQVAVFSSPLKPGIEHYHLRIYFLNKTPCALQWAKHNEAQFNGELVCPEKVFLLKGTKEDAVLELLYLSHDWENVNTCSKESVTFQKIWHGMCPRAEFCFHRDLKGESSREININFSLFQKSSENADKIVIQMAETTIDSFRHIEQSTNRNGFQELKIRIVKPSKPNRPPSDHVSQSTDHMSFTVRPGGQSSDDKHLDVEINPGNMCWEEEMLASSRLQEIRQHIKTKIPIGAKRKLILLLAPLHEIGTDWRDLASAMGFNCIPFLQTLACPVTALLDYFETQGTSLLELKNLFLKIHRTDAACVIDELIGNVPKETCEHSDSCSDNE